MPIISNNSLAPNYVDGYQLGNIYLGSTQVQGDTFIPRNGLMAYWNSALTESYPGSGSTWYDLSGKGNNMTLSGSYSYVAASSSIKIPSGSNTAKAYTPSNISSTLNGSGSTITVVQMIKFPSNESWNYPTSFYLGGTTAVANEIMANVEQNNFTPGKISIGNGSIYSQARSGSVGPNQTINWYSYPGTSYVTNWNGWSFLVYTKQNSDTTYPTNYNNIKMYTAGWWNAGNDTTAVLGLTDFSATTTSINGYGQVSSTGGTGNVTFNLQETKYYLGANPLDSDVGGMFLGAQAIYNRVLSNNEMNSIIALWNQYYKQAR